MKTATMWKVLCPVEGKNGKTFWMRVGSGFENRDGSKNLYLDAYPANGRLQLRQFDEEDLARTATAKPADDSAVPF